MNVNNLIMKPTYVDMKVRFILEQNKKNTYPIICIYIQTQSTHNRSTV